MRKEQEDILNQSDILINKINKITNEFLDIRTVADLQQLKSIMPKIKEIKSQYQALDTLFAKFYNTKPNLLIKLIFKYKHRKLMGVIKAVVSLENKLDKRQNNRGVKS